MVVTIRQIIHNFPSDSSLGSHSMISLTLSLQRCLLVILHNVCHTIHIKLVRRIFFFTLVTCLLSIVRRNTILGLKEVKSMQPRRRAQNNKKLYLLEPSIKSNCSFLYPWLKDLKPLPSFQFLLIPKA